MTTRSILTNQLFLSIGGPLVVRDRDMDGLRADAALMAPYFRERLADNRSNGLSAPALRPFHIAADRWNAIQEALY